MERRGDCRRSSDWVPQALLAAGFGAVCVLAMPSPVEAATGCLGVRATVVGTEGPDVLRGGGPRGTGRLHPSRRGGHRRPGGGHRFGRRSLAGRRAAGCHPRDRLPIRRHPPCGTLDETTCAATRAATQCPVSRATTGSSASPMTTHSTAGPTLTTSWEEDNAKDTCLNGEDLDPCETTGPVRTLSNRPRAAANSSATSRHVPTCSSGAGEVATCVRQARSRD